MSSERVIRLIDTIKFMSKERQSEFANDQYMSLSEFLQWLETELVTYVPIVDYQQDFEQKAIDWLKDSFKNLTPLTQQEIRDAVL